jgi:hypothetical protein
MVSTAWKFRRQNLTLPFSSLSSVFYLYSTDVSGLSPTVYRLYSSKLDLGGFGRFVAQDSTFNQTVIKVTTISGWCAIHVFSRDLERFVSY